VTPGAQLQDDVVSNFSNHLKPGDVLVFNDTKVIPARLFGRRVGRGDAQPRIEVTLHQRMDGARWKAFAKPGRKLVPGDTLSFAQPDGAFVAAVEAKGEAGEIDVAFNLVGADLDQAIAKFGILPLPPYIASKRAADERDELDYQTMFATAEGAVAAPTAALHFTPTLMAQLANKGIGHEFVTLHVGAGTFLPVKASDTSEHIMHSEWGSVGEDVASRLNEARERGGRIIAVGTTAMRLLESAADECGAVQPWSGSTGIFITPGYKFKVAGALMTNFHLPKSTLFMLVSAFCGLETMKQAYAHAVKKGYRFYSYGDSSLLWPQQK
jgi:S-adenosylmethionine:tRNA ribosyltransferase-isomerase